ncbi:MAG: hypothetical protein MR031_00085 [Tenericutes bacterium]|nr:hypothetical protein [Mycoplasmatota bacterium]
MLLESNTKKVIDLIHQFDNLSDIDKVRLAIYLLENKNFNVDFNVRDMIILLKQVLSVLDPSYTKVITNFSKYKHLLFFSAKYLELTEKEKKHFSIEMIFNIYENDFKDKIINDEINNHLLVYDYCYSLINNE